MSGVGGRASVAGTCQARRTGRSRGVWRGERGERGRYIRAGLCALVGFVAISAPVLARADDAQQDRFGTVIIDPGHGGDDDGARGAEGLAEKDLVLAIAEQVAQQLVEAGIDVTLTRTDDTFVPLEVRTSIANDARGDLFVSIHANSAPSSGPSGIETFFVSLDASDDAARRVADRENEAFGQRPPARHGDDPLVALLGDMMVSEHVTESSEFSKLVQHELAIVSGVGTRGVKQAPFVVLMGVQMPASLIEIGFLSNPDDERALRDEKHRRAIAGAVARAVVAFGKRYDARRGVGDVPRLGPEQ